VQADLFAAPPTSFCLAHSRRVEKPVEAFFQEKGAS